MRRRLNTDRLTTLTRADHFVDDHLLALTAGLDDRGWISFLGRRFADMLCVEPGEYPTSIDQLNVPYCGLIVLHLNDPMQALTEAAQTIQKLRPVLLVECMRGAHQEEPAGQFLARLGARELYRAGPDRIYGWAR